MSAGANFLDYPAPGVPPGSARAALIPVPYDGTVSYRPGARFGPAAIIAASAQMEDYDIELGCDPSALGIHTAPAVEPGAGGPAEVVAAVERAVEPWAEAGTLVGVLGGEHTVAVGAVRSLARHRQGLSVLFLDAHADMRDAYTSSAYSHACTARRIAESCDLVQVGVRSAEAAEWRWMNEHRVPVVTWPPPGGIEEAVARVLRHLGDPVYVSLDLDVLDPSVMAAVGTPEPGGMTYPEMLAVLRAVAASRTIAGFDVSELAPAEGPEACSYTAAKLVYKIIGYSLT